MSFNSLLRAWPGAGLIACVRVVLVLACLTGMAPDAAAQLMMSQPDTSDEAAALPDPLTPETIRELVSTLSDQQVRALLLERLDAVARETSTGAEEGSLLDSIADVAGMTADSLVTIIVRTPDIPAGIWQGLKRFFEPRGWSGTLWLLAGMGIAIGLGLLAEFVVDWVASGWRQRIRTEKPEGLGATLGLLLRRILLDAIGLIVFWFVTRQALLALLSMDPPATADGTRSFPDTLIAITFVWWVIMLPRMFRALNRFLIAPKVPALRLVHTDDWTAQFLTRHMTIAFAIWGFMAFMIPFLASHGSPMGQLRFGFWLNLAAFVVLFWSVYKARAGLVLMMAGHDQDLTKTERQLSEAYPYLCLGLGAVMWIAIEALVAYRLFGAVSDAIFTMVILLFAPAFDTAVRGLVRHLVPPMSGEGPLAEMAYHSTKRSYVRIGRVIIAWLVISFITRLWGLDWSHLAQAGVGAQLAGRAVEVIYILMAGYLVWEVTSLWINRKLAAEQTQEAEMSEDEAGGEGGGAGGSRLATVLPLLLGTLKAAIAVVFGLIALGNIGIDITPLLAGAGIAGLAIGFGAQKLVTDVVSGIFFLVDDAFRVGEYVEVEGTRGTVEKISVRSMQLRHHLGPVHTIPYGEIPKLSNFSRDWVIMKLKFTVPFETDPNKVKKLFKQVGKEMMEVPEFAQDLLQPFKSQGVFDFDDVGMIIRGKFMAKPGRQFVLRKEIYNRVKKILEENGIQFARREVRVAIPGLESASELTEEQKSAVSSAAAQAVQDSLPTDPAKP